MHVHFGGSNNKSNVVMPSLSPLTVNRRICPFLMDGLSELVKVCTNQKHSINEFNHFYYYLLK